MPADTILLPQAVQMGKSIGASAVIYTSSLTQQNMGLLWDVVIAAALGGNLGGAPMFTMDLGDAGFFGLFILLLSSCPTRFGFPTLVVLSFDK